MLAAEEALCLCGAIPQFRESLTRGILLGEIIVDKIQDGPPHALSKEELKLILTTVPEDWVTDLRMVRLLNSLPTNSNGQPAFIWAGDLAICSRGRSKEWVVREILYQLAQNALGWKMVRGRLTRGERANLDLTIAPFVAKLTEQLNKPAEKVSISLAGFKEIKFGN